VIAVVAVAAVGVIAVVLLGSGSEPEPKPARVVNWPAPKDPLARAVLAGLKPERKEFLNHHVHAHLDVFLDGKPVTVPSAIGINIGDPEVKRTEEFDGSTTYGGIELCRRPCISPLHTHDSSGVIHTEARSATANTLGAFFIEWGVRLTESCVGPFCRDVGLAFHVDGKPYMQDPRAIQLTDQKEIAIVIGRPPKEIPSRADFSGA
jgi:hypothetical protein